VFFDITEAGLHTVSYTVTDPKGLTGTVTRIVIISPAEQPSTPAANDNASSTVPVSLTLLAI
jgi:PKD repeat protein